MVITTGSPREAVKMLLSKVGNESGGAAKYNVEKELEELTFRVGKKIFDGSCRQR